MPGEFTPNNPFSMLVNHLENQKQQARAQDDAEIDRRITLIHDLISGPGANPARTAEGLGNLMELYGAKNGKGKPKAGAGPWGGQEIPLPSILAGVIHGNIPMEGHTTEPVPQPQSPAQQGLMPEASAMLPGLTHELGGHPDPSSVAQSQGYTGNDVLKSPVMIPPQPLSVPPNGAGERMLGAARDMQRYNEGPKTRPVANQPMRIAPDELAQEAGYAAGVKTGATRDAEHSSDVKYWKSVGFSDGEIRQMLKQKAMGAAGASPWRNDTTPQILEDGAGNRLEAYQAFNQVTGERKVVDRNGLPVPPGYMPVKTGAGANGNKFFTDDKGNVTAVKPDFSTQLVGGIGKSYHAPPPQMDTYDTPDPQHPGQTVRVSVPKSSERPGSPTSAIQPGADGQIPNPPKSQNLTAEERNFVDNAQAVQGSIDRINKMIEEAHLENANSLKDWTSTQAANLVRRQGFEPSQFQADLQQQTGYIKATLLRSLLQGRPNKVITDIFAQHLPAEFQTPAQIHNTLRLIKTEIQDRYQGISAGHGGQALPALGAQGVPPPPGGAQSKMITVDLLHQYAQEHKITDDAAREFFISHGYAVVKQRGQ